MVTAQVAAATAATDLAGVEAVGSGDLAYLRGTYSMTFSIPGVPTPIEEQGKFRQIYRKQSDGSWKMTREIYNSDLPLPTPPPTPASGG
jgi:ketosteroid isomerase-like protein